jgi:hypothetical protein
VVNRNPTERPRLRSTETNHPTKWAQLLPILAVPWLQALRSYSSAQKSLSSEPVWVVINICMETTQGISLHSYPHCKLAKHCVFLFILHVFSSTKSENKRVQQFSLEEAGVGVGGGGGGGRRGWGGGECSPIMYTH